MRRRASRLGVGFTLAVTLGSLLVALSACGGDDDSAAQSTGTIATTVNVAVVGSIGSVLTDPAGLTLYVFALDTAGSGKSSCTGSCATAWPPFTTTSTSLSKPEGLPAALGVISRDDGAKQVTYGGRPLYHFSGDKAPGDAGGHGINADGGVWSAASVDPAATPAAGTGGLNY